jgi:hypothetical protein
MGWAVVGMLWIGRLIFGPFGPTLVPLGSFVLEPHFDAFGQRLLGASSFAVAQGLPTELKQDTAISSLAIRQQGEIAGLRDDLAQESYSFFQQLAVFPSTVHVPNKTCRPIHEDNGPSLRLVRRDLLMDSRVEFISFNELLQKLMRQGKQEQSFFTPLSRSCQR